MSKNNSGDRPFVMSPNEFGLILLVEDSEDDAFLMNRALGAAGVKSRLHLARDGQEAKDYLSGAGPFSDRQEFPLPGFVFLDLKLPYFSGFDVLEWMAKKTELSSIFVAVLTSSEEPQDIKTSYRLGARTFLVKPPSGSMIQDVARAFDIDVKALGAGIRSAARSCPTIAIA